MWGHAGHAVFCAGAIALVSVFDPGAALALFTVFGTGAIVLGGAWRPSPPGVDRAAKPPQHH